MKDYSYLCGTQVVNSDYSVVGTLTGVSGRWGCIDEDFELNLDGSDVINDLMGCNRERHPELKACFIRLADKPYSHHFGN